MEPDLEFTAKVLGHLESLGYEVYQKHGPDTYVASQPSEVDILLTKRGGGYALGSIIPLKRPVDFTELLNTINATNSKSAVANFFVTRDEDESIDIMISAWWPGVYEKEAFENFMNEWHADINRLVE